MPDLKTTLAENPLIDDRIRGFPPGHAPLPLDAVGKQGWKPYDGKMALPLISLDQRAFAANVALMMAYVRDHGVAIAPHAKTPMAPAIAGALLAAGAWGTTVADIRQAAVLLKAGQRRLILANEIGGPAAARRLAALAAGYPDADLHVFVEFASTGRSAGRRLGGAQRSAAARPFGGTGGRPRRRAGHGDGNGGPGGDPRSGNAAFPADGHCRL